jgi:small subunit ribosomal protein S6
MSFERRKCLPLPPIIKSKNTGFMQNYELMVIFTPVLSEDEFKSAQKKYAEFIAAGGGSIVHSIQKKTTGIYWVMEYVAPSDMNEKLKIQLLRDEQVLRHIVIKLDKYAVEYNTRKRSGVSTGNEKAVEA